MSLLRSVWIMTESLASARLYEVIGAERLMRKEEEEEGESETKAWGEGGKLGNKGKYTGWRMTGARRSYARSRGKRQKTKSRKGDGEVRRGMGGGRRLPRLKWNIDRWRRAQPLQPTRPCPPFSADLSPLWTPPKFLPILRESSAFDRPFLLFPSLSLLNTNAIRER